MITKYLKFMENLYDQIDALMILNKEGVIEYSTMCNLETNTLENEGFVGYNILEVYPTLTKETSSHFRVMNSGKPIYNDKQILVDMNQHKIDIISTTYPLEYNNEIIGTISATILISNNNKPINRIYKQPTYQLPSNELYTLKDIITDDPVLIEIKGKIEKISKGFSHVLIHGDTGTGKELVAQAIHSHSLRCKGPFISQNCSAIPTSLLEGILFGTMKGSYTGAENRKGIFELANNGTLFLDEIKSMDISIQAKILKAIEEKKIRRIGDEKETKFDVRVVSAMNEDPFKAIEAGQLRRDLYFRLAVVQIKLPPLKERKNDILLLTDFFIQRYNEKMNKNILGASDIVKNTFYNYEWSGNIRELKNTIEYAFNLIEGNMITLNDIPEYILYSSNKKEECFQSGVFETGSITQMVDDFEKKIIVNAIATTKNITQAAKKLQITRQSLRYKMEKFKLS